MSGKVVHVLSGEPYDLYIGRAMLRYGLRESFWANPFKVSKGRTHEQACFLYEQHARFLHKQSGYHQQHIEYLEGLTLACWCPDKRGGVLTLDDEEICHGQVLLRLARELS